MIDQLPLQEIEQLCRRWRVLRLRVFGSILGDLRPDSDMDFLVEFQPGADVGLFDRLEMQYELEELVGQRVDLVRREPLTN
ncbi:MAG: nucleotidyltransferase domain-containing protein, partial [Candidatus Eremiobacterota bacterium]